MDHAPAARRAQREIVRLCHAGLDSRALRLQVLQQLRAVVPVDALFCATVDPTTLLFTGSVVEEIPEGATPALLANEFLEDDVNKFVDLARASHPVQSLFGATDGAPNQSARYREIFAPLGFGDELRAALRLGSVTWGVVCLHRARGSAGFTLDEAAFLGQIAPQLAEGLRAALLFDAIAGSGPGGPGLVMVADDYSVISTTPTAERWLEELSDWPRRREPPQTIRAVAARLQAQERTGDARVESMPRARARTRSGRWLTLHAARLSGLAGPGAIAVIIEPAAAADVAPLVLQAYALTERETQIAQLVLRGTSTAEMVDDLAISALTVQQHLKAIFDKTGVRSRRELAARLFAQRPPSGSPNKASRAGGDERAASH